MVGGQSWSINLILPSFNFKLKIVPDTLCIFVLINSVYSSAGFNLYFFSCQPCRRERVNEHLWMCCCCYNWHRFFLSYHSTTCPAGSPSQRPFQKLFGREVVTGKTEFKQSLSWRKLMIPHWEKSCLSQGAVLVAQKHDLGDTYCFKLPLKVRGI